MKYLIIVILLLAACTIQPDSLSLYQEKFSQPTLIAQDEWTPEYCIEYMEYRDDKGYYIDLPTPLEVYCKQQQICENNNCTYISSLLAQQYALNAQELIARVDIARSAWVKDNQYQGIGIDTPRTSLTGVYVFFNASKLQWQVINDTLKNDWIPQGAQSDICAHISNPDNPDEQIECEQRFI